MSGVGTAPKRLRAHVVLLLMGAFASLCIASQADAAPGPVWKVTQVALPTNFIPGTAAGEGLGFELAFSGAIPQYNLAITNLGGAATNGPIILTDDLPPGLSPATESLPEYRNKTTNEEEFCEVSGQAVTCVIPGEVGPGEPINVAIPVAVSATPPADTVTNVVTVSGGGAPSVTNELSNEVTGAVPSFGFLQGAHGLSGTATESSGAPARQSGSHPFALTLEAGFPSQEIRGEPVARNLLAAGTLRRLVFSLPNGVVVNPQATGSRCTESALISETCPPESQAGELYVLFSNFSQREAAAIELYNMVPPPGTPAEFGFNILGTTIHVQGGLSGDFHLTATSSDILAKLGILNLQATLWGSPSDESHDGQRRGGVSCHESVPGFSGKCPVLRTNTALVTMPSACSGPLALEGTAGSWESPGLIARAIEFSEPSGAPLSFNGCDSLQFTPTIGISTATRQAHTPTGLTVDLRMPQNEGFGGLATANLKKVSIQLPPGITVNPPAATGLGACAPAEIGLGTNLPQTCPESAKVGTVEVRTPLLAEPLKGAVYIAEQGKNPFGSLLALYVVAEGEGVVVKLPGRVDPDSTSGQLRATFDNNPQLPFSQLRVSFTDGPRAALTTPKACGSYLAQTELTSWASDRPVRVDTPMKIESGCGQIGFAPSLTAGTVNPLGGSFSTFALRITQVDSEQNLSRISAVLPPGLLARLAGVPLCSQADAASGACPSASQVGTTTTGIGTGSQPLYIPQPGKAATAVYLAGPYGSAPYSFVVKVPAQAGPFDLGTIAVRVALEVDPFTAQVTAKSDPLPQILEGIPVSYRDVRVEVDRPHFIVNPTSCDPMAVRSSLTAIDGMTAGPVARFQMAGCERLGFKPKLSLRLKGNTMRTGHPSLRAVVTYPEKGLYANTLRAQVGLPSSEFLDQGNLNKVCTQPHLRASQCPKTSVYGHARAWTPLLDRPLQGPVYLAVGFGYKLPALVADLNGQVRILLKGKVDTTRNQGIRTTFEAVPDAPITKFVLEMKGGRKYGLLENSENICRHPQRASAQFDAQNADSLHITPLIATDCRMRKGLSLR